MDDFEKEIHIAELVQLHQSGIYFSYIEHNDGLDIIVKAQMDKKQIVVKYTLIGAMKCCRTSAFDISEIHALITSVFALNNRKLPVAILKYL